VDVSRIPCKPHSVFPAWANRDAIILDLTGEAMADMAARKACRVGVRAVRSWPADGVFSAGKAA
jgi:hypothetical protein